jgi:tetratricopeptide (TPR) repeat protein
MSAPPTSLYPGSMLQTPIDSAASTYQRTLSATNWPSYATLPSPQTNMAMGGMATPGPSGMTWVTSNAALSGTIPVADPAQLLQSLSHPNMAAASRLQPAFVPSYQQSGSPVVYSPGALAQTPLWRGDLFPDYRNSVPVVTGYAHQNAAYDGAFLPSQPNLMHGLSGTTGLGLGPQFQLPMSALPLDDGFARYSQVQAGSIQSPNRRLEALSLNSATTPNGLALGGDGPTPSPARFKERALAHAHKTYADLLVYLSHSKRAQHARDGSGSTKAVKMMVFPKPPKQLTSQLSPTRPRMPHSLTDPLLPYHARAASHSSFAQARSGRLADAALSPSDVPSRYLGWTSTVAADMASHPSMRYPLAHNKPGQMRAQDLCSPPHSARACLDVLSTLCEQSEWKWVDGILLGGCLQYGLEHYEDAVVWFNRILDLDPNHVETLSNIAATLYCLNRLKEAEEYWLKAIQIRPSYLEAVEHMVGLLCSNGRSEEAVQVISTVLEALRLPDVRPRPGPVGADGFTDNLPGGSRRPSLTTFEEKQHAATFDMQKQPGFGSSGYAVPGVDNGRILLLVHARGNMLYALKQVDRASQAFEEAVIISAGRKYGSVQALIRKIQTVLRPRDASQASRADAATPLNSPLLLAPDRAKHTSQLVFASSGGHLPGLRYIAEGSHRRAAVSTTSNALLSLAKIFQDASTSGSGGPATPGALGQAAGVGDILALYYLSLSLQESPSTANNVGILLAGVQQGSAVQLPVVDSAMVQQQIPGIVPGSGLSLALAYYKYGLQLDPKHVHLHTNLGSLLKDIGQLDLAINMYESAVACDGTFDIALTNLANAVKDRGKIYDAIVYYKRAVQSNPDFAEAVCGLSTALNSVCDWRNRGGVVLEAGRFDRWHVDEEGMLVDAKISRQGVGLMKRVVDIVEKQLNEAAVWGNGLLRQDSVLQTLMSQLSDAGARVTDGKLDLSVELQKWADRPWEGSRIVRLVERSTRAATHRWYSDRHLKGVEAAVGYPRPRLPSGLTVPVAPTVLPFHTFTCPLTARDIRLISQRNALRISASTLRSPWLPRDVYPPPKPPAPHLNIGYLSSDFNNHPLAHLMQSVFGFHNPKRAKAFCYATTASDKSAHRLQIEREAPVFRDVSTWSSEKLVDQIVQDDIHILVNLNGYTRGARNEIFAARPAPIQMSFMGFAGTLGSEWCDYLLADSTAIPPSTLRPHRSNLTLQDVFRDEVDSDKDGWVYSENIIFCRDTFFCCDHAQAADAAEERAMTWDQELQRRWRMRKELFPNLADNAIILGNFNQLYKVRTAHARYCESI